MNTVPTPVYPSAPIPAQRPGWFARNWKWFVPCGCATILVAFVAFILAIIGIVMFSMKSSDIYSAGLRKAQSDQQVVRRLGTPITAGWWTSGNINVQPGTGNADMTFPISGPKGKATVHAAGIKRGGEWKMQVLQVTFEGSGDTLDLVNEQPSTDNVPRNDI